MIIKHLKIFLKRNRCTFLIGGCSKAPEKKDYVARVNNEFLTREELNNKLKTPGNENFYKNEIIRNWINKELLYQKALKEGIADDSTYISLIEDSKKELALIK